MKHVDLFTQLVLLNSGKFYLVPHLQAFERMALLVPLVPGIPLVACLPWGNSKQSKSLGAEHAAPGSPRLRTGAPPQVVSHGSAELTLSVYLAISVHCDSRRERQMEGWPGG